MILLLSQLAIAGEVSLLVDTPKLSVGEAVRLQVSVESPQQPPSPAIPPVEGLEIQLLGPPTFSQSFSWVNGQQSQQVHWVFTYQLKGTREGSYTLGPVTVGSTASEPLAIQVGPQQSAASEDLSVSFGTERAWVGQTLLYSGELRTELRANDRRWKLPAFTGLADDPLAQGVSEEFVSSVQGARVATYRVHIPLIASEPGEHTLSSAVLTLQIPVSGRGLFVRTEPRIFTGKSPTLQIQPLPEGQDPATWSGLVGSFTLEAALDRDQVAAGESAQLQLRLSGDGSFRDWIPPELSLEGAQVFGEVPATSGQIEDGAYRGQGRITYAILPSEPGVLEIPPIEIQVFDPELGAYRTLSTRPAQIEVLAGADLEPEVVDFGPAQPQGPEGEPQPSLERRPQPIRSQAFSLTHPLALLLMGLPVLGLLVQLGRELSGRMKPAPDPHAELRARIAGLQTGDLAGAMELLRACGALATGRSAGVLQGQDLASFPDPGLFGELQAARYGAADPGELVERTRRLCVALLEAAP